MNQREAAYALLRISFGVVFLFSGIGEVHLRYRWTSALAAVEGNGDI